MSRHLVIADEVTAARSEGRAVVALESTLLAHGLPQGRNLEVGARLERIVRDAGAVPATIAVLDGMAHVGLTTEQLERVCSPGLAKLSLRDLGAAFALKRDGATTVASTAALAHQAGIKVFATGGLGGVHLAIPAGSASWDVSADLDVLAATPVTVVCSGVKSILDIAATVEVLETKSVPVVGYRTDYFPGFYLRESAHTVPWRVDTPAEAAGVIAAHHTVTSSGVLLVNPVPPEHELDRELHDRLLSDGMALLQERGIRGKDVTPALLEFFHNGSGGASLSANTELVADNARVAAEVAVQLSSR
ncbi:pseudouridine-5'-phosphate glycosidase [Actinokineospora globicatena]|uniref:pseudouridine-5'-phosphate glycosidase n=1 Tax=Actinokineospora globicatena TaxID=103729 RepID=UPI0020A5DB03|nr:pseudouridine-5'-phosphate glycosidase [Actinokineospora globicatena]MCP2302634.1 pseudouridine-5'-phosphate glycosidase [Actinokineospora globicatena]GLW75678.1 pseudouridine-5'-phosphate glycosidase [Actinokineospora globicatena]GLW82519.1 pseudouridine-5'-phosphate glycosidase [Actinokineospora globicatena]